MKSLFSALIVILLSVSVVGCMTNEAWNRNPVVETTEQYKLIKADPLISFGQLIHANNTNKQFVVIGKENIYVLTEGNEKITEFIHSKFPNSSLALVTSSDQKIRLNFHKLAQGADEVYFTTDLKLQLKVLHPTAQTVSDLAAHARAMQAQLREKPSEVELLLSVPIKGKMYKPSDNIKFDGNTAFNGNYMIEIGYFESKRRTRLGNLIGNIVITPFALVADAIIMPIAAVAVVGDSITGKGRLQPNAE